MVFWSLFKESVIFALQALIGNKLRSILSLLGITIGIFAVIMVFTIVDSLEQNLRKSVQSLGNDVVFIQKWPWTFGPNYPWWKYMNRPVPDYKELNYILDNCDGAQAAAFMVYASTTIKHQSSSIENVTVICASHQYDRVKNFEIADGRYFTDVESASGRPVAVIGDVLARVLFPNQSPLGQTIKVRGAKVMVIGVFKKEGESILGGSPDTQVLLPVNYARSLIDVNDEDLDPQIMVRAKDGITNDELISELTGLMRSRRRLNPLEEEDFALNQTSLISNQFDSLFDVVGIAGWIIGGFSILVGGFGIANIMFVSVKERTNIIGIQKSLGAKNYFILMQFLFESVFLSVIGGFIGLLIVYLLTLLAGDSMGMEIQLSKSNIILGFTISILIGVVSGFVPAYGASQLDPVEAIRSS
ncbi:MAG: FtsX-like permease family protein [Bacteroidota bacterium]|nr:FtsX-like permease family protein [Bacteroidota bacterium]